MFCCWLGYDGLVEDDGLLDEFVPLVVFAESEVVRVFTWAVAFWSAVSSALNLLMTAFNAVAPECGLVDAWAFCAVIWV